MSDAVTRDPDTGSTGEAGGESPPTPVMSLDEARALLVREHNTAIGRDDPLLMAVTLHQGFVGDYETMLRRHDAGIRAILGATAEACAGTVERVLEGLKDKTVKASLEQAFALVAEQARNMDRLDRTLRIHRVVNGLLTLVSVTACGLGIAVLYILLR